MTTDRVKKPRGRGRPFPKGTSGNPLGRQLEDPEFRAMRRLAAKEVAEIGTLVLDNSLAELIALKDNPKTSALRMMLASMAVKAISKGNATAFNALLDRVIGKPKETIELSGPDGGPLQNQIAAMTHEEMKVEILRLEQLRKAAGED